MQAAKTTERQPSGRSKIAHRTGTSFTNKEGMTGAINDYGIIELPGKRKFILLFLSTIPMKALMNLKRLFLISEERLMITILKISNELLVVS